MNRDYGNGQFEFIRDSDDRALYRNMHAAITQTELWDWMRTYEPHEGFMNSEAPEVNRINTKMREDPISFNHSGASYGCMMRNMEFIAKNGYEAFKADILAYYQQRYPEETRHQTRVENVPELEVPMQMPPPPPLAQ